MPDNEVNNLDFKIDFKKIWLIIFYRKTWIILSYTTIILIAIILTILLPKKYEPEAKILFNKTQSTNLSELNPFVISESSKGISLSKFSQETLENEVEILKSPLVLEPVIKENSLKYEDGPKKGKFLSVKDFIDKGEYDVKNIPKSNVIDIKYINKDPKKAYNVLISVIKNSKQIFEKVNSIKATKDRIFLENAYNTAKKEFEDKLASIKQIKLLEEATPIADVNSVNFNTILLSNLDKRVKSQIKTYSNSDLENKKLLLEVEGEIERLKILKERFEWSLLVEQMSKNASNIQVIQTPDLLEPFEDSGPGLIINLIIALVVSFSISCIIVVFLETTDDKVTYWDLDGNYQIISKNIEYDFSNLLLDIKANNITNIALINLSHNLITDSFFKNMNDVLLYNKINVSKTTDNNILEKHINNIESNEAIILLSQIGYSNKRLLNKIKHICKKTHKLLLEQIFAVE